ncbi:S8 family serine peptidase [Sphingomonas mollis]|uniref:S8 family serine peptidase n=1 Tax=Sphingomonas mollis TaxID=2795726 RepID=A0ABS0XLG3_9SPHN|nr:S8 family serine peptidase [Sphingomonas sp. BT553]MBJ6120869.1 S8 family serine peptidase [Sphingomonas sp. BT553]
MATNYRKPTLGRAYDYSNSKLVNNANDLYNPQGGGDAELMRQWHLKQLGDIGTIWKDFTGKGVSVGVYDEGVQKAHWDLDGNYDSSKHVVINGTAIDGSIPTGPHGTSVSGLIAAERNGRGGVGVAYDAKVTGVNIFDTDSPLDINGSNTAARESALRQANQFDVVNHSWAATALYGIHATYSSRSNPDSYSSFLARTFDYVAETGRGGLGTVTVMAAGNDNRLSEAHAGVADRHAIAVGAYRQVDGVSSYYSNHGAHLLVSAPSSDFDIIGGTGVVTTDLLGAAGYNWSTEPEAANDYTDQFGGTSAATPIVSGVVSLMLSANDNLGWRDVQNILAASAKMPIAFETGQVAIGLAENGVRSEFIMNNTSFKLAGADANWNGGRMHFSNDYGYGAVDAYNAVRMAEVWGLFAAAKTSANEVHETQQALIGLSSSSDFYLSNYSTSFNDVMIGNATTKSFEVEKDVALERLDLTVSFSYDSTFERKGTFSNGIQTGVDTGLLLSQFKLTAPDGSTAFVPTTGSLVEVDPGTQEFTLGFSGLRGVESKGKWALDFSALDVVIDVQYAPGVSQSTKVDNKLTVSSVKLDMYGSEVTNDDVYTYTNEFFTMTDIKGQSGRKALVDTDGGTDWINAAAVSHDIALSLVGGQATAFDGEKAFTIGRTSVIEGAVTGDGNDTLIGNRYDNYLYAMRGNDTLNGGGGNDYLFGGTGGDRFLFDNGGTSGKDTVLDFSRGDMVATQTALRGMGTDGKVTVANNATLLLDGLLTGDTVLLSQNKGAVLQSMGQKDGYFWYSYLSGADLNPNQVIREVSFQPELTAVGAVQAMTSADHFGGEAGPTGATLAGSIDDHGSFYLYDAMSGSMSGGVLLHA